MVTTKAPAKRASAKQTDRLPVPPRIVAKVIEVAAHPDSTAADLASLIGKDPTLTSQMLRAVNSAHYGLRQKVETVQHAVAFMGMSAVRNLVLCIGVQQLVRPADLGGFPLELFWECSIRRAAAAACLARRLGLPQPDEFFTIGLCQDIGILGILRQDATFGSRYAAVMEEPADDRLKVESALEATHDAFGGDLLQKWKLPDDLTAAVRHHHRPDDAPEAVRQRCLIAQTAEAIADLFQVTDKALALNTAREQLEAIELDPELLQPIVKDVSQDLAVAAAMLQMQVSVPPSYDEILAMASDGLLSLIMDDPGGPNGMETAIDQQQRLTAELGRRIEELERQAATDTLTGLANRRLLDDMLARELAVSERQRSNLSFLLVDVDNLKEINQKHGHKVGDLVLREVANSARRGVRRSDACARFGGDEFAVVLPFTNEEGGQIVAERTRRAVAESKIEWQGAELSVTVSVGGVTVIGGAASNPVGQLVEAAEKALDRARRERPNAVYWHGGSRA